MDAVVPQGVRHERVRSSRVVLIPRRWDQVCRSQIGRQRGLASPVPRGERGVSRKAIAQGVPDRFGEPVVTTCLWAFYPFCPRGCGCVRRPAFPAPSDYFRGTTIRLRSSSFGETSGITRAIQAAGMRNRVLNSSSFRGAAKRRARNPFSISRRNGFQVSSSGADDGRNVWMKPE